MTLIGWSINFLASVQKVVLCYCYCSEQSSNHTGQQVDDVPHGFGKLSHFTVSFSRLYALTSEINVAVAIC